MLPNDDAPLVEDETEMLRVVVRDKRTLLAIENLMADRISVIESERSVSFVAHSSCSYVLNKVTQVQA